MIVPVLPMVAAVGLGPVPAAGASVISSSVRASDGQIYRITNHLTPLGRQALGPRVSHKEWLLVWAGDLSNNEPDPTTTSEPDFLAVIDATKGSPSYGTVVNTVTVDNVFGNEPHHLQYQWHRGDKVYASGLFTDTTFIFDVKRLPEVRLSGITPPSATKCGTAPASYHVLSDGTAYGSMVAAGPTEGPCRYTDGQVRVGNGSFGTPGELVHIAPNGQVLAEIATSLADGEIGTPIPPSPLFPDAPPTDTCVDIPALPQPSCANPYGLAVREDLNRMVVTDFAEPRNTIGGHPSPLFSLRDTARVMDISNRNRPKLVSLQHLPQGPRVEPDVRMTEGIGPLESAVTHLPNHRGAFVATANGAIYYTPDITAATMQWREVYDDSNAFARLFPTDTPTPNADAGTWIQVSPDDRYLYHTVMGGGAFSPGDTHTGMLYALDIRKLLAADNDVACKIDTLAEVAAGGAEPDCPTLASVVPIRDETTGGPQAAVMDTFHLGNDGFYREDDRVGRIALSDYWTAFTNHDGNHTVCMFTAGPGGQLAPDTAFKDEVLGTPCVDFKRAGWPHGATGEARPHGLLFVVADKDLR
ncbi:hypothetical protein [Micromonospora sp. NPDC003776]